MHLEEGGLKGTIRFGNQKVIESLQVKCDRLSILVYNCSSPTLHENEKGGKNRSTEKIHKHARIA